MRKLRSFVSGVVVGLTIAAIGRELELPPEQRTWKGTIAGIPYNFRFWEWQDIAHEYWNPQNDQIIVDKAIGVGWGVNFAALGRKAQEFIAPPTGQ